MAKTTSFKRLQINKANTMMVIAVAAAAFITVFSLVAARALWVKRGYQQRVITEKELAVKQLEINLATVDELTLAYRAFVETPNNVIGGNPSGSGDRDGDNAKIVLDALPSKYDFPALATSLEKILKNRQYDINSISGTDDEVAQSTTELTEVSPIEMLFDVSGTSSAKSAEGLLDILERSIRPIYVNTLQLSGTDGELQVTAGAKTYYQPEKPLNVQKKVVK